MATACDTLLCADVVVSQNDTREISRQAALAISAGRIVALGPADELRRQFDPRQVLDLSGCLVLPGLVNAHIHAAMTLFRGLADDVPLDTWLTRHIWPAEARLTAEAVEVGTLLACAEMLSSGTTCFLDAYLFTEAVAQAVETAGLRAVIAQGVFDIPNPAFKSPDEALIQAAALADRLAGHDRLRAAVFPHAVYTCSAETLGRCASLARERGLLLSSHAAENPKENADCLAAHGTRVVPYLKQLGLTGPDVLLAHGVDLTRREIDILAETDTRVAHCPRSNAKLASGVAPVHGLRQAGVTVALGTDGAASNNALNLFLEMGTAALLAKVTTSDPTALSAQAVLDLATRDGGGALGWPELGRLVVGGPADLCALDLSRPALTPGRNPVSDVVYAASGGEVRLTMVKGEVLYRDGEFTRLDYPALLARFRVLAAALTA